MEWGIKQGAKIKELRLNKGFSITYVAKKIKYGEASVYRWETGKGCPRIQAVRDLAFLYNVPTEEITGEYVNSIAADDKSVKADPRPFKPKNKYAELIALMSMMSDRPEQDIIDSAIECYARNFPWQSLVEQHFLGDNKEA